jgi:hypothetical protein
MINKQLKNIAVKFYNSTGLAKQIFADMLEEYFLYEWHNEDKDDFNKYISQFR